MMLQSKYCNIFIASSWDESFYIYRFIEFPPFMPPNKPLPMEDRPHLQKGESTLPMDHPCLIEFFRLLTDFVCLLTCEVCLSLWKIAPYSVILLLPLFST